MIKQDDLLRQRWMFAVKLQL